MRAFFLALIPAALVAAGAYRLARYNGQTARGEHFTGLPITASGVLLAAAVASLGKSIT